MAVRKRGGHAPVWRVLTRGQCPLTCPDAGVPESSLMSWDNLRVVSLLLC